MTNLSRRQFLGGAAVAGAGVTAAALPSISYAASPSSTKAATVIRNARVFVGDNGNTVAEAIAIGGDGTIVGVGSYQRLKRHMNSKTQVIDGNGGAVVSGIQDGHVHPMYAGLRAMNPSMQNAELSAAEVQDLLSTFLADPAYGSEPDSWLKVEDWNPAGCPSDTLPHKDILDSLNTSRPIAISGSDGHNLWVNSRALQIAGIDSATPDPTGGEIVHDANGDPTGVLKDAAQDLVRQYIPEVTPEEMYDAFAWAFAQMAAGGITTVMDAWVDEWQLDFYAALADNGQLPQRVFPAMIAATEYVGDPQGVLGYLQDVAGRYGSIPNMTFRNVKVFMDGVIEYPAQTAALVDPYQNPDGTPTNNYGDLYIDGATLGAFATVMDAADWQVHAHAIGDGAVRAALDGYAIARAANGMGGRRHTIAHLQLVHPDDYGRFSQLNVIPDMQLQWATTNVWTMEALLPFIGPERHARMYPANSMQQAGARLAGGSDWPVDPLFPWNQVASAVDRIGLYGEEGPLNPWEGITREQSLRMHTRGTAYQLHQEQTTGTLEVGKQADLVLLDRDVTSCPVTDIKDAVPQLTMLDGQVTFDLATSSGRAVVRSMESAAKAKAITGPGRLRHEQFGGRHDGCPCTAGGKH